MEAISYPLNSLDAGTLTQMGSDQKSILFNALWHQPIPDISAESKKAVKRCIYEDSLPPSSSTLISESAQILSVEYNDSV